MRIGLLSDVHANRVALEAVLADCPPVDALLCAGDVVGYGPDPAYCVERLRERAVPTVMGNHDRAVAAGAELSPGMAGAGVAHARHRLDRRALDWLAERPSGLRAVDRRVAVVHGHPEDPDRYVYPGLFSADLLERARGVGGENRRPDVLVLGHTHVQAHERYEEGLVVNPGSVGQPRDGDPRAAYAVLDLGSTTVEERRVEYDVEAVVEAVRRAGLPEGVGTRLRKGR